MELSNVELTCKYYTIAPDFISNCDDAISFISKEISKGLVERFILICMDYDYKPICYSILGVGDADKILIDIGELFRIALLSGAKRILVAHNHLGTSSVPTESDILTTKQIGQVAKILNIEFIDSIVIAADDGWTSIRKYVAGLEK